MQPFTAGACNRWCIRIGGCVFARWIHAYLLQALGRSIVRFEDRQTSFARAIRQVTCFRLSRDEESSLVMLLCQSRWPLQSQIRTSTALAHAHSYLQVASAKLL
ncbi:hypothetical protein M758_3G234100 [Ceratodon purpureus]|nr:hypothetical protein M758_3G234100 [Ceratodon purpureus]